MFSTKLIAAPCVNSSDVKFVNRSFFTKWSVSLLDDQCI